MQVGKIIFPILINTLLINSTIAQERSLLVPPRMVPPPLTNEVWYDVTKNKYKCTVKKITDGDTFKCDINIPEFQVILLDQSIRVSTFDAPEVSYTRTTVEITEAEIKRGLEAKKFLEYLTQKYEVYITRDKGKDPYGRLLADVWLTNNNHKNKYLSLKEVMTSNGYSR